MNDVILTRIGILLNCFGGILISPHLIGEERLININITIQKNLKEVLFLSDRNLSKKEKYSFSKDFLFMIIIWMLSLIVGSYILRTFMGFSIIESLMRKNIIKRILLISLYAMGLGAFNFFLIGMIAWLCEYILRFLMKHKLEKILVFFGIITYIAGNILLFMSTF